MAEQLDNVTMRDVRIIFRNFAGKEQKFNAAGDRNFAVLLDDDVATAMLEDGWNVKVLNPREDAEEDETPQAYLPVKVKYGSGRPPSISMITSRGRTAMTEDSLEMLDWVDIVKVDMIVRPYNYDVNGKQGISAYVKTMMVTIEEDELEAEYGAMAAQSTGDFEPPEIS